MGESRQYISVPLIDGINNSVENLSAPAMELNTADNVIYDKSNGLTKRLGFEDIGHTNQGGSSKTHRFESTPTAIYSFTSDGYMNSLNDGYFFSQNNNINTAQTVMLPSFLNEVDPVVQKLSDSTDIYSDVAATPNHVAWVYKDNVDDNIKVVVRNRSTGAVVFNRVVAGDVKWPRLTPSGNSEEWFLFTYVDDGDLYKRVINAENTSAVSITSAVDVGGHWPTTEGNQPRYDACPRPAGGWDIVYQLDQNSISARALVGALGTVDDTIILNSISDTDGYGMAITNTCSDGRTDDGYVWVAIVDGYSPPAGVYMWAFPDDLDSNYFVKQYISSLTASETNNGQIGLCRAPGRPGQDADGYHCLVTYMNTSDYDPDYPANGTGFSTNVLGSFAVVDGAADVTGGGFIKGMHPFSKPFHYDGNAYQWFSDFMSRTNYLMQIPRTTGLSMYPITATTAQYNRAYAQLQHRLFTVSNPESGTYITGALNFITALVGQDLNDPNKDYKVGLSVYESKNDTDYLFQAEEVGGTLYISGGALCQYDGVEIQENNFLQTPQIKVQEIENDTTNPLPVGTYSYIGVYEYIDNDGLKHYSVPSNPASIEIKLKPDTIGDTTSYVSSGITGDVDTVDVGTAGPSDGYDVDGYYVVTTTGGRGAAQFKVSVDGGTTLHGTTYTVPADGEAYVSFVDITFNWPDATFTKGDSGTFHLVGFTGGATDEALIGAKVVVNIDDSDTDKFTYRLDRLVNGEFVGGTTAGPYDIPGSDDDYRFQIQDGYSAVDGYGADTGVYINFGDHGNYQSTDFWITTIRQKSGVRFYQTANQNTYRYDGKSIVVPYRTLKDGSTYYRMPNWEEVDTWSMTASGGSGLVNVPTSNTSIYAFQDLTSDDDIQYNATLYSPPDGSGVLPNDHPWGGVKGLKYHKNRLWMISAETPTRLFYTKEYVNGEALSYSLGQELDIGDKIVGLSSHDEGLIVLCENGVYVVLGQGPDATGDPRSGAFEVFKINGPPGCWTPGSIQTINDGTIYQAKRGIVLLTKGYQQVNIGDAVDDQQDTEIYRSINDPKLGIVVFSVLNSQRLLVMNYQDLYSPFGTGRARWCTWTPAFLKNNDDRYYFGYLDGDLYLFHYDESEGEVKPYKYGVSTHQDGSNTLYLGFSTNFYNFGTNMEKRLRKLKVSGYYPDGAGVTVLNTDANETQTVVIAGSTIQGLDPSTISYDTAVYLKHQKGRAWAIYFTETPSTSYTSKVWGVDFQVSAPKSITRRGKSVFG